jgi:hypothetical protein
MVLAACGEGAPSAVSDPTSSPTTAASTICPEPTRTSHLEGYPLDRSLKVLVSFPDVDTILVLEDARFQEAKKITWGESEAGTDSPPEEGVITPGEATVAAVYRGSATVGQPLAFALTGGTADCYQVVADRSIAAQPEDFDKYPRMLIGGQMVDGYGLGSYLAPIFVYGVGSDDMATSVLESAGADGDPVTFSLDRLRRALAALD